MSAYVPKLYKSRKRTKRLGMDMINKHYQSDQWVDHLGLAASQKEIINNMKSKNEKSCKNLGPQKSYDK